MSLTIARGPLSQQPAAGNYRIDGPAHRLFFEGFPRRVRGRFGGETVLDSRRGMLLHETGLMPQLYVPRQDVRQELLTRSDKRTHCQYKGNATYFTLHAGGRQAEAAAWAYLEPIDSAAWLREHIAFYWRSLDTWLDEDEEVSGHLRDPYHRVDVRASSRRVRVRALGRIVAETVRPKVLSETGLPNRFYIPPEDVLADCLEASEKQTVCPYKGAASYRTLRVGDRLIEDAAWVYEDPLESALKVRGHLSFLADGVEVVVV